MTKFNESTYRKKIALTFLLILLIFNTMRNITVWNEYQDAMTWEQMQHEKEEWSRKYRMYYRARQWSHPISSPSSNNTNTIGWMSSGYFSYSYGDTISIANNSYWMSMSMDDSIRVYSKRTDNNKIVNNKTFTIDK